MGINVPKCLATSANAHPPVPPLPPSDVDPQAPVQVWAGKLSEGRIAVVLVNADSVSATVTAKWEDIWLSSGTSVHVRDAISHVDKGTATDEVSAVVESHDVAVLVLTPQRLISV